MSWDDTYNQLEQQLGRKPTIDEVQQRMLEIAMSSIQEWQYAYLRWYGALRMSSVIFFIMVTFGLIRGEIEGGSDFYHDEGVDVACDIKNRKNKTE